MAGAGWLVLAAWRRCPGRGAARCARAGACLGFLWHNWSPATNLHGRRRQRVPGLRARDLAVGRAGDRAAAGACSPSPSSSGRSVRCHARSSAGPPRRECQGCAPFSSVSARDGGWSHARIASAYGGLAVPRGRGCNWAPSCFRGHRRRRGYGACTGRQRRGSRERRPARAEGRQAAEETVPCVTATSSSPIWWRCCCACWRVRAAARLVPPAPARLHRRLQLRARRRAAGQADRFHAFGLYRATGATSACPISS